MTGVQRRVPLTLSVLVVLCLTVSSSLAAESDVATHSGNDRKSVRACAKFRELNKSTAEYPQYQGNFAALGEFPHMAALYSASSGQNTTEFKCEGSLISERFILTAAHCVHGNPPQLARMGAVERLSSDDGHLWETYEIVDVMSHPGYKYGEAYNNIALLRLSTAVSLTNKLFPACLSVDLDNYPQRSSVYATGWGTSVLNITQGSVALLKFRLTFVAPEQCGNYHDNILHETFRKIFPNQIESSQFCTKDLTGHTDSCHGDSGGPLQLKNFHEPATIVGITAFGLACGMNHPTVYTRVSSFLPWIEAIVWPDEYND